MSDTELSYWTYDSSTLPCYKCAHFRRASWFGSMIGGCHIVTPTRNRPPRVVIGTMTCGAWEAKECQP